jgi:protein TonB
MIGFLSSQDTVSRGTKITRRAPGVFSPRIWEFLLVSFCAHAALVATPSWNSTRVPADSMTTTLSVRLSVIEPRAVRVPTPSPARAATTPQRKTPTTTHAAIKELPSPLTPASERPIAKTLALADDISPTPAQATPTEPTRSARLMDSEIAKTRPTANEARESARTQIRTLLLEELAQRFDYPHLAQRRGWEGTVLLSVTVNHNGAIERIQVTRSSGYDILDGSAVDSLRRVGQLAGAEPWLHSQELELLLPVVYRLTD